MVHPKKCWSWFACKWILIQLITLGRKKYHQAQCSLTVVFRAHCPSDVRCIYAPLHLFQKIAIPLACHQVINKAVNHPFIQVRCVADGKHIKYAGPWTLRSRVKINWSSIWKKHLSVHKAFRSFSFCAIVFKRLHLMCISKWIAYCLVYC